MKELKIKKYQMEFVLNSFLGKYLLDFENLTGISSIGQPQGLPLH